MDGKKRKQQQQKQQQQQQQKKQEQQEQEQEQEQKGEEEAAQGLSIEEARRLMEPFAKEELVGVLSKAAARHGEVLDEVLAVAGRNPSRRKLFVRALSYDTTSQTVKQAFSRYGGIDDALVVADKATGKSRGYAFVTFKRAEGALRALREPSKKIDGHITVTQLSATGPPSARTLHDQNSRKIHVGSVPLQVDPERLLNMFSKFGEIEEGPLGLDKSTNKAKGFALFLYKTVEGAKRALEQPIKSIDGHQLQCSPYAGDSAKLKGEGTDSVDLALLQAGGSATGAASLTYQHALAAAQALGSASQPGLGLGNPLVLPHYAPSLSLAAGLGAYSSVLATPQSAYGTALGSLYNIQTAAEPIIRGGVAGFEGSRVSRTAGARFS